MGTPHIGIRWSDDVGWELRCNDCVRKPRTAHYWPLTEDFWDPKKGMQRCIACHKEQRNARERRRYWTDPEYRQRIIDEGKRQRAKDPKNAALRRRIDYLENIDHYRARARERYWRDVEATRARRREQWQRRKAA